MLTKLALISLGGGIGAALRFYVGYGVVSILPSQYLHYSFIATFVSICWRVLA